MRMLYAAGILDALYEEDAYAEKIVELLCHGRTRKEARRYYGIESTSDVEKAMQIIDEDRLKSFLSYIENGGSFNETLGRYEFIASRMTAVENLYLIRNMGSRLPNAVCDSELFRYYHKFLEEKPKKRFGLFRGKKESILEPENIILQKSRKQVVETGLEHPPEMSLIEPVQEESIVNEKDDMIQPVPPVKKDVFADMQVTYEEESIYDLFGDGSHSTILDFMEEERDEEKQDSSKDTRPFPGLPKEVHRVIELPEKKISEVKERKPEKVEERGDTSFRIPKPLLLSFLIIVICLILSGVLFVRIYGEREIPMVEGIPVTSGTEADTESLKELENSMELAETENIPAESIVESMEEPVKSEEEQIGKLEQSEQVVQQENEREEEHVQEENKENEQNGSASASESSESEESAKATEQAGEPDHRQQADAPPSGTEERETGEDARVEVEASQQPEYEISREPLSEEESSPSVQSSTDYHGKIVSGDELEEIVVALQAKGMKSYIVTRENGEGYFSSSQIREKCDPACSFLVSISGSEAKLIEQ